MHEQKTCRNILIQSRILRINFQVKICTNCPYVLGEIKFILLSEGRLVGWCEVDLGNRVMTVEAARQCAEDKEEWRALHGAYVTE